MSIACTARYTDLLQVLKAEPLSSVFSTGGTLISASAAPHCRGIGSSLSNQLYFHQSMEILMQFCRQTGMLPAGKVLTPGSLAVTTFQKTWCFPVLTYVQSFGGL